MSSDESFLWTSASNSNSDSDAGSTSHKISEMKSELKEDFVKNELDGKYKNVKNKVINGKIEKEVSQKNCIKHEPTSDVDSKIVKDDQSNTGDMAPFNDSYLNLRIKEEELSYFNDSDLAIKKKKKNKKRKHSLEELNNEDRDLDMNQTEILSNYEDKITIDETVITSSYPNRYDQISTTEDTVKHKKKKKKRRSSGGDFNETNISEITCNNDSDQKCIDESNPIDRNHFESGSVDELEPSVRNLSKVSDRIQFEEDISDMDSNKSKEFNKSMNEVKFDQEQIRQYLKKNTNLQRISSKVKQDSIITDTDDVWLLKCPQDVDIMHLKDIPLSLSNKTKLKMGGKVYDYMVDDNNLMLPIMTYNQNKPVIKTLTTNGCIILKNRVPKVHIPDNEIMVNDQTNFIPLPDTKCRHPLFGIHYKKFVKVSAEIAKRLYTDEKLHCLAVQDTIKEKRKKHKKERNFEKYGELQEQMKLEHEVSSKKKKRKHSTDPNSPVKSKKVKYDPDSAQTWDSEKAIEENLFNF